MITGVSIFIAEALVMLFLSLLPELPPLIEAIVDSVSLSLFVFPVLYFFLFRPMLRQINIQMKTEEELKRSKSELETKISELVFAQKTLHESEGQYKLLFDQNPNPMWIFDLETLNFLLVNDAAIKHYGYSREEFLSMTLKDIRPEEDIPLLLDSLSKAPINDYLNNFRGTWRHIKKGGMIIFVDIIADVLEFKGRKAAIVVVKDVTNRKQAEEELQKTKSELEVLVAERTRELQTANIELLVRTEVLEQRNREINLLSEMNSLHQVCNTTEEAYTVMAKYLEQLFPEDCGELLILNTITNMLEPAIFWGNIDKVCNTVSVKDCWALRRGQMHIYTRDGIDLKCKHSNSIGEINICLPMIAQGEALGIIHLMIPSALSDDVLANKKQLALSLAEQISLSLSNIRLRETLRTMSIRDSLTGLYNRLYMEEFFKQEIHRAYRKGTSIGVIIIDIDHFKRVNDTLGHDAGDMLLAKIGKFLHRSIRESDIVCRFGGEEFVIIMPEATVEVAAGRAQELRKSFKLSNLDYESLLPVGEITISLGVSAFPRNGLTAEAIFKAADDALYEAKDSGRDRVCVAKVRENNPAVNSGSSI